MKKEALPLALIALCALAIEGVVYMLKTQLFPSPSLAEHAACGKGANTATGLRPTHRNTNNTGTPSIDSNSNINSRVPLLCKANPYRNSLLKLEPNNADISLASIEKKANSWLANKTAIRDDMYQRSYGKPFNHDKFNAFEVMADCNYTCTGRCRDDATKIICGASNLQPGCVVYSIGGNNLWQFETHIYDTTPCEIHTFDCTGLESRFHPPEQIQDRHTFHHVCLGTEHRAKPERQVKGGGPHPVLLGEMLSLEMIQKRLGHLRLDLLKLDIEGYEWPIFNSWPELTDLEASANVALPMQILVEIHYRTQMHDLWPTPNDIFKDEVDMVELQAHLLRMGYAVVVRDDNRKCQHCTELTLLRYRCLGEAEEHK